MANASFRNVFVRRGRVAGAGSSAGFFLALAFGGMLFTGALFRINTRRSDGYFRRTNTSSAVVNWPGTAGSWVPSELVSVIVIALMTFLLTLR